MFLFIILQSKWTPPLPVWIPLCFQEVSKHFFLYVIPAILAPCLPNLPSLISSPAALILVSSVAFRPSHFLLRRIWALLTALASAASLCAGQQTGQDKQEGTGRFIQITNQTLDGSHDNTLGLHFQRSLLVKLPHLDGSYLAIWDCLFCLEVLSAEKLGSFLLTDLSIWGCGITVWTLATS